MENLTQEQLKELLHYDPETGVFTWRSSRKRIRAGSVAGSNKEGYVVIRINQSLHYAHRLAFLYMGGALPEGVDHINHDRADNRWSNLREASRAENLRNCSKQANNTSGVTGVSWDRARRKWAARISAEGRNKYLGLFDSLDAAAAARKTAEQTYGFHRNHGK